jgi:hypothetical protein
MWLLLEQAITSIKALTARVNKLFFILQQRLSDRVDMKVDFFITRNTKLIRTKIYSAKFRKIL